jgi:hypothetical protein
VQLDTEDSSRAMALDEDGANSILRTILLAAQLCGTRRDHMIAEQAWSNGDFDQNLDKEAEWWQLIVSEVTR